jgi:N-acetylglucosaminyldiphosphoundecaprenol N-acetyl-beta-D-mannosaminyltransferase
VGGRDIAYPFLKGKISALSEREVIHKICQFIEEGGFHLIVTCDAYSCVVAWKDEEFASILRSAHLVTPDGMGVVLGAKMLGIPVKGRVAGADIVNALFPIAEKRGWKFFFLGGRMGVAEEARQKVKGLYPYIQIVGCHHGYFKDEEKIVNMIRESGADILLVGMGIPLQEKFIWRNREKLGVKVAIGVGGTLDVLSGRVKRAPRLLRQLGLEWLYRLVCQPSKIEKVARLPYFYWLILRSKFFSKSK